MKLLVEVKRHWRTPHPGLGKIRGCREFWWQTFPCRKLRTNQLINCYLHVKNRITVYCSQSMGYRSFLTPAWTGHCVIVPWKNSQPLLCSAMAQWPVQACSILYRYTWSYSQWVWRARSVSVNDDQVKRVNGRAIYKLRVHVTMKEWVWSRCSPHSRTQESSMQQNFNSSPLPRYATL